MGDMEHMVGMVIHWVVLVAGSLFMITWGAQSISDVGFPIFPVSFVVIGICGLGVTAYEIRTTDLDEDEGPSRLSTAVDLILLSLLLLGLAFSDLITVPL